MKFCPNCGNRLNENDSFCSSCGSKLNHIPQPPQYQQQSPQPNYQEPTQPDLKNSSNRKENNVWKLYIGEQLFKNYVNFRGTCGRSLFWRTVLAWFILNIGVFFSLVFLMVLSGEDISLGMGIIYVLYCLGMIVPSISLIVRRLRDAGESPLWILLLLLPFTGAVMLIVFLCQPSYEEDGSARNEDIAGESEDAPLSWFQAYVKRPILENYVNFKGKCNRKEFWATMLCFFLLELGACGVTYLMSLLLYPLLGSVVFSLFMLGLIVPQISLIVRRFNDLGKSPWLILLGLVPFVGTGIVFGFASLRSEFQIAISPRVRFTNPKDLIFVIGSVAIFFISLLIHDLHLTPLFKSHFFNSLFERVETEEEFVSADSWSEDDSDIASEYVTFRILSNEFKDIFRHAGHTSEGTVKYNIVWPVSGNPELVAEIRTWIATQLFYENSQKISQMVKLDNPTELLNKNYYSTLDFDLAEGLSYETIEVDVSMSENDFEYKIIVSSEILNSMIADRDSSSKSFLKPGSFKLTRNMLPANTILSRYVWIGDIIERNSDFDFLLQAERMKNSDNFWNHIEDWSKIGIPDDANVSLNEDGILVSIPEYLSNMSQECEVTIPYSVIWSELSPSLKSAIPEKYLAKAFGDDDVLDEKTVRQIFYTTAEGMLPTPLFEIIKTKFLSASLSDLFEKAHKANENISREFIDMTSLDWVLGSWLVNGTEKDDNGYIEDVTISNRNEKKATAKVKYMNFGHPNEYVLELVKEPMTMPNGKKANKWVVDNFSADYENSLRERIIEAAKADGVTL